MTQRRADYRHGLAALPACHSVPLFKLLMLTSLILSRCRRRCRQSVEPDNSRATLSECSVTAKQITYLRVPLQRSDGRAQ